jgi:hypothetical protein
MDEHTPVFDATTASWSQAVLFQTLITELIESEVLPVDRAQRVFDVAIERANSARDHLPDAERLIAHIRDDLRWDYLAMSAFWGKADMARKYLSIR